MYHQNKLDRDFPAGPVVKTLRFQHSGTGSILGQGTKIPWVTCAKKEKKRQSSVNLGSRFLGCTERAWPQLET